MDKREPMEHELKCWPEYYDAMERGDKPFEVRKWDRPYRVGDTLLLRRYDPEKQDYTGEQMRRKITYLLDMTYLPGDNVPRFAGYVVIGIEAADLIESLQAQLAAMTARAEQAEKERDAAVKDIMCHDHCDVCASGKENGHECKNAGYDCMTCKSETCMCRECRDEDHWEWRGLKKEEQDG